MPSRPNDKIDVDDNAVIGADTAYILTYLKKKKKVEDNQPLLNHPF